MYLLKEPNCSSYEVAVKTSVYSCMKCQLCYKCLTRNVRLGCFGVFWFGFEAFLTCNVGKVGNSRIVMYRSILLSFEFCEIVGLAS